MAPFAPRPEEFELPYYAKRTAYDQSLEAAINTNETNLTRALRVDDTIGRAVYAWDNTAAREQLIYGDTGWRALSTWTAAGVVTGWALTASWAPTSGVAGGVYIRRQGRFVSVRFAGLTRVSATTPYLFNETLNAAYSPDVLTPVLAPRTPAEFFIMVLYPTGQLGRGTGGMAGTTNGPVDCEYTFPTTKAWPTVTVGTAYGTIPHA